MTTPEFASPIHDDVNNYFDKLDATSNRLLTLLTESDQRLQALISAGASTEEIQVAIDELKENTELARQALPVWVSAMHTEANALSKKIKGE